MTSPYFEAGGITLWHGDALAVLAAMPAASVDAVITDPPYSSGGAFRADRAQATGKKYVRTNAIRQGVDFHGDNRDQRAYGYWCALWMAEALRVTRPGGVFCTFTDWRQLPATSDAVQAGGWVWRGVVPWLKPSARPAGANRFTNQCEYVVWGSAGGMPLDYSGGWVRGFFQANVPRDREHQTQKPLDVMRELMAVVPQGGTVCDPFMGSGTTGVAAVIEGHRFVGVEQHAHYIDVARDRIAAAVDGTPPGSGQGVLL